MQITVLLRNAVDCRVPLPVDNYQEKPLTAGMVQGPNPSDWYALEQALQLSQSAHGAKVSVLAVGDEETEKSLRWCRAAGADRVERIWDPALQNADQLGQGKVLAAAINRQKPGLVLCGDSCLDQLSSLVPGIAAATVGMPYVPGVDKVEKIEAGTAIVIRRLAKGKREKVIVHLPALLSMVPTSSSIALEPDLPAVVNAFRENVPCLDLTALGVADQTVAGRGVKAFDITMRLRKPPLTKPVTPEPGPAEQRLRQILSGGAARKQGEVISGDPKEIVEKIVEFLRRQPAVRI